MPNEYAGGPEHNKYQQTMDTSNKPISAAVQCWGIWFNLRLPYIMAEGTFRRLYSGAEPRLKHALTLSLGIARRKPTSVRRVLKREPEEIRANPISSGGLPSLVSKIPDYPYQGVARGEKPKQNKLRRTKRARLWLRPPS